jgi:hypothetical protein
MVDEFRLDPKLHETIKGIRESVRLLFEQLRLRNEVGDVSGRKRLERIPALAKNNFGNLTGSSRHLAAVEAWRLVAFIEGGKEAQMSPLAREALRVVELDKKLAALRASDEWTQAASRLREALGVEHRDEEASPAPVRDAQPSFDDTDPDIRESGGAQVAETPGIASATGGRTHRSRVAFTALSALAAVGVASAATWHFALSGPDPRACTALETASPEVLERHWATTQRGEPLPRPKRTGAKSQTVIISDVPGGEAQSIWTTSQFSYAEGGAPPRPGGGKSDNRLQAGGWGDTYLSLLRVPVLSDRRAHKAILQLTVMGGEPSGRPTSMTLRAIGDRWHVGPGPNSRLWWRDCPGSDAIANHLPAPGPRGSVYEIDITDLYNHWVDGFRSPYGIILEPEHIGSWGPGRPSYPNLSVFYSTRARDPENRPRLVLTY